MWRLDWTREELERVQAAAFFSCYQAGPQMRYAVACAYREEAAKTYAVKAPTLIYVSIPWTARRCAPIQA